MDNSLVVQLGLNLQNLEQGLHKSNSLIEGFKDKVGEIGAAVAGAFALEKVADFTFEISELAAKASGVKQAFSTIPGATSLLNDLRKSVQGTVSDLDLMTIAGHAQNLNIPMQDLGEIIEFVHQRALATGQDFNSLADIILKGIGQGSTRALMELQVSTEKVQKAAKDSGSFLGGVMSIIREESEKSKMGMDKTLEAIESSTAAWENLKLKMGEVLNQSQLLAGSLNAASTSMDVLSSSDFNFWDKINFLIGNTTNVLGKYADKIGDIKKHEQEVQNEIQRFQNEGWKDPEKFRAAIIAEGVAAADVEQIMAKINESTKKAISPVVNLETLQKHINELKQQEQTADLSEIKNIEKQIKLEEQRIAILKSGISTKISDKDKSKAHLDSIKLPVELDVTKGMKDLQAALNKGAGKGIFEEIPKQIKEMSLKVNKDFQEMADKATQTGLSIGNAFGPAITGHRSFESALAGGVESVVKSHEKEMIAAIANSAAQMGLPPPIALGIAAAGIAAFESLIGSAGAGSGGGSYGMNQNTYGRSGLDIKPQQIQITGQVQGRDIVYVYDKSKNLSSQARGN